LNAELHRTLQVTAALLQRILNVTLRESMLTENFAKNVPENVVLSAGSRV
jgi:hypothetical protein